MNRKVLIYFRDPVPRNLSDVKLIPPYDQVVLDNAFTKIDQWSINLLRDAVLEADDTYKKSQFSLRRCTSDISLGVLPCARFMLAALGMLTVEHAAPGVSLLLNSGVLALTQVSKVKLKNVFASYSVKVCRVVKYFYKTLKEMHGRYCLLSILRLVMSCLLSLLYKPLLGASKKAILLYSS